MRREHFDFYGYNSPTDGKFYVDGGAYTYGEDFRNVKRYKEYKDVGFNILLLQHMNEYWGEKWETSACKKCMDKALEAGLDRIIVSDGRLKELCTLPLLVGEEGKFKTENELIQYVDDCTKPYRDHPAFYGLQLLDEPIFAYLKEYAHVYRVIKKVVPNAELQCNLLNLVLHWGIAPDKDNLRDKRIDYADYLRYFAKESGINYLMTDEYAFRRGTDISNETIPVHEVLASVCKELGIEMRLVVQSFCQVSGDVNPDKENEVRGGVAWRRVNENDMYWQLNLAMGFGVKEFSFFTYFPKVQRTCTGRVYRGMDDGAGFINRDGSRTKLYYYTKRIIKEMKAFESVILNYQFEKPYYFYPEGKSKEDFVMTKKVLDNTCGCPITVKTPKNPVLVTELKNGKDSLYMVENIGNTLEELLNNKRPTVLEIDVSKLDGNIKFYRRGKQVAKEIIDGKIKEKTRCGDAIFIEVIR